MRDLVIATDEGSKGRSFRATLLSYATSRQLWAGGEHDNIRPIWAMLAMSDAESLPFIRNLQGGRKAILLGDSGRGKQYFECLKSAGYVYSVARHPEGAVWTIFLPELYQIDPGMVDPEGVKFAVMPSPKWLAAGDEDIAIWLADLFDPHAGSPPPAPWEQRYRAEERTKLLAACVYATRIGPLFCAYLDRRTRCPLIPDPRFYALVLAAMLQHDMASFSNDGSYSTRGSWGHAGVSYHEHDIATVGATPGVACRAKHEQLEPLLAWCVKQYEAKR